MSLSNNNNQNKTIYVGHVSRSVDEDMLTNIFERSNIGTIKSLKIYKSKNPKIQFHYAIITYNTHDQADKAIKNMNSQVIDGFPVRVSYFSKRNKKDKAAFNGDITIKNLKPTVSPKYIIDRFQKYGKISSFKIPTDKDGNSYGVVYIHYDNNKDALKAVNEMNGKSIKGQKITVYEHTKREYTNLHIKSGLPSQIKTKKDLDEWLKDIFSEKEEDKDSIEVLYVRLLLHPDDPDFREAILSFANPVVLKNAMDILKLHDIICYPESKLEIEKQLNKNKACWNNSKNKKYSCSIYVKNFPQDFNEKQLERLFWTFKDFKKSSLKSSLNGFKYGFVSFKSSKSVKKALEKSCLISFQDENNKKKVLQLYASLRNENKHDIDQNKFTDLINKIIDKYSKRSFHFRLFIHMSPYQKLCLVENEKLFKKWEEKCDELASSITDDNDVEEEEEENDKDDEIEENEEEEEDDDDNEDNDYDDNSQDFIEDEDEDSDADNKEDEDDDSIDVFDYEDDFV